MIRYIKFLLKLNFKTLYFNLKYLPFREAVKLPFLISRNVYLYKTDGTIKISSMVKPGMIKIGYGNVGIFDKQKSRTIWQVAGDITFFGNADIGHGSKISVNKNVNVTFGKNFKISAESEIVSEKQIIFGDDVLISWNCLIMDTDFHEIYDDEGVQFNTPSPIIIGNKVWIGCRSVLLKGTQISDNTIIGANSLVCKNISDKSGIYAGNPVKLVKKNVTWKR